MNVDIKYFKNNINNYKKYKTVKITFFLALNVQNLLSTKLSGIVISKLSTGAT